MYGIIDEEGVRFPVDIRLEFPNTSFPEQIERNNLPENVVFIEIITPEIDQRYHKLDSGRLVEENGSYKLIYDNLPLTEEETEIVFQELTKEITVCVKDLLNNTARLLGYDDIISACSFAGAENVYRLESERLLKWRASVWESAYSEIAKIDKRNFPLASEILDRLPKFVKDY